MRLAAAALVGGRSSARPQISSSATHESFKETTHSELIETRIARFAFLLRSFAFPNDALLDIKRTHHHIINCGLERNSYLGGLLLSTYAKCAALEDARALFASVFTRNVFLWNSLIRAYAQQGHVKDALRLFKQLHIEGINPDKVTFVLILSSCADQVILFEGKQIHALFVECGYEFDVMVWTSLINMYGKCGSLEDAREIFDKMQDRDVITWNAMITVYVQHGQGKEALSLFDRMHWEGEMPNKATFVETLSACTCSDVASAECLQIHMRIIESGFESDVILGNALVSMYGKCGNLEKAWQVFDAMLEWNVITWNAMLSIHSLNGQDKKALLLFDQMKCKGVMPNKVTFVSCLSACAALSALDEGVRIHIQILGKSFDSDAIICNSLINMYGKCSNSADAWRIFDKMPQRNLFSWTVMIAAYSQNGKGKEALQLFDRMHQEGEMADKITLITVLDACDSNAVLTEAVQLHARIVGGGCELHTVVGSALVNMYGKCGNVNYAHRVFENLLERNVASWSAMITVYAQNGQGKEALLLFYLMQQEGFMPDSYTLGSIFDACATQAALTEGMLVHASIMGNEHESGVIVGTALVNMYSKSGSLIDAQKIFDNMPEWDLISWNAIIAAYAQYGHGKEVFKNFHQMQLKGIAPNTITFISVLSACSHAGLINEGFQCFASMHQDHGLVPTGDHYDCMIDLLGRVGRLDEAERLMISMPFQPTVVSLVTLLSACRYQNDTKRGKCIAEHLFDKDPENAVPYIMLCSIYTATHKWDDAAEMTYIVKNKKWKNSSSR